MHSFASKEEDEQVQLALDLSRVEDEAHSMKVQRAVPQCEDDGELYREEFDVTKVFGLLTMYGGERLRLLGLDLGVTLLLKHLDGTPIRPKRVRAKENFPGHCGVNRPCDCVLMDMEGTRTALTVAAHEFQKGVLDNPADYRDKVRARWQENVFVLADNSNIFISAQYQDGGERDPSVRLSLPKLCDVVLYGRNPRKLFVAGSHSYGSEGEPAWKVRYENEGFMTYVEDRRLPTLKETAVDDVLHAQAMSVRGVDYGGGKLSQTLILLTGDGNGNDGRTTFPDIVCDFMKHNADREVSGRPPLWKVEIIAWRRALSHKMTMLQKQYPGYVAVRYLDEYREYVTYREVGAHGFGLGRSVERARQSSASPFAKGKENCQGSGGSNTSEGAGRGAGRLGRGAAMLFGSAKAEDDRGKGGAHEGVSRWHWISDVGDNGLGGKEKREEHNGKGALRGRGTETNGGGSSWSSLQRRYPLPHPHCVYAHGRSIEVMGKL